MEALTHNITNTCPSAFAGNFGALFAQTIATMVTAHCAIVGQGWPNDGAAKVLNSEAFRTFDLVIAGAGTAGSLLASRLSSILPTKTILLVEAGGDPGLKSEIPMLLFFNNDISWNYRTEPDSNSCQGFKNKSCLWVKGRAIGGSSSINAMLYVRGHSQDFEEWEKNANENWSYEDVKPYFETLESRFGISDSGIDREDAKGLYDIYTQAWEEIGYKKVNDNNNAVRGTRIAKLLVNKGQRKNTAKISLGNAQENLVILKNTVVQKVIIDESSKTAVGIQVKHANGRVFYIQVKNEVILSAGSVATPQILMLSGIGPKKHLQGKKIKPIVDLPVGKNLQDHLLLPLLFQIDSSYSQSMTAEQITSAIIKYLWNKKGLFSSVGISDFMAFVNTKNESNYPDIQFHHTFFPKGDQLYLKSYFTNLGYTDDVVTAFEDMNKAHSLLGVYPTLLHPKSRGEILLRDSTPESHPIIKANYFKEAQDIKQILSGVRLAQKLLETNPFKNLGVTLPKLCMTYCNDIQFNTDDYWECYIRHIATTVYHPVGTAKMGSKTDKTSVVGNDLKVKGMRNLRVVDASIMPTIVGGNTMAATLMLAEKAANIILKEYISRDEL